MSLNEIYDLKKVICNGESIPIKLPILKKNTLEEEWQKHENAHDFFPYWMTLWNSVFGLKSYLETIQMDPKDKCLEIGCGAGILAQVFPARQGDWFFSDLILESLKFIQKTQVMKPNEKLICGSWSQRFCQEFQYIVASDILYESKFCQEVATFVWNTLAIGGQFIIANPVRTGRDDAIDELLLCWKGKYHLEQIQFELSSLQVMIEVAILEK